MAGHEDPLCLFDHGTPPECSLQALILAEALKRDVDRALQLVGIAVDDVREHAALGGLMDVGRVAGVEQGDHRARCLAHDLGDQLQCVRRARPEPHQCDVGVLPRRHRADVLHRDLARDHVVPETDHDLREQLQPVAFLIRDQNTQMLCVALDHCLGRGS